MIENNKMATEEITTVIEITEKATDIFNLTKNKLTDKSKLALRIVSSSRG